MFSIFTEVLRGFNEENHLTLLSLYIRTQSPNSSKDQVIPLVLAQTEHKEPQLRLTFPDHNFQNWLRRRRFCVIFYDYFRRNDKILGIRGLFAFLLLVLRLKNKTIENKLLVCSQQISKTLSVKREENVSIIKNKE
jgi:hypothetical protein